MDACHKGAFLVAGWTGTALLARVGDEHLVHAVWAANASKAFLEIPTLEKGCHGASYHRAPVAVLGLKPPVVDLLEGLQMLVHQAPQVGGPRIAWLVQRDGLDARCNHEKSGVEACPVQCHEGQFVRGTFVRHARLCRRGLQGRPVVSAG